MKKKWGSALIIFAALSISGSLFTGCAKTVHCPAYDYDTLQQTMFPYTRGQMLIFINTAGRQDSIHIASVQASPAYDKQQGGGFMVKKVDCQATGSVLSAEQLPAGINKFSIQGSGDYTYNRGTISLTLTLNGFAVSGFLSPDSVLRDAYGLANPSLSSFKIETYTLGNHTYKQVQGFYRTDTASLPANTIWKLYLAKEKGIVGYELFPSHEVWGLQ